MVELDTGAQEVVKVSNSAHVDPGNLSIPKAIEFPTEGGLTAHAFLLSARKPGLSNRRRDEKPPLVVHCHGGPTASAGPTYPFEYQYWTSRGFAIVDVNYGGSAGYGRAYRTRLNGNWGVVDVDDCINAARYLVEQGLVDGDRVSITGGSAGGFTVLLSLTKRDFYNAGASHFGIGDLVSFIKETHKFESRYLDTLVGPYPERADLYRDRSAVNFADNLNVPVILFQGLEDKIVPPSQAEEFVAVCQKKKLPYAYVAFEGEQHGFRQEKNIRRAIEGEMYFLSRIFGFRDRRRYRAGQDRELLEAAAAYRFRSVSRRGGMADAPALGAGARKGVEVQILSPTPGLPTPWRALLCPQGTAVRGGPNPHLGPRGHSFGA